MKIFREFFERRKVQKMLLKARRISALIKNYVSSVADITESNLRSNIEKFDLDNQLLFRYIAYLSGVIFCACEYLGLDKNKDAMASEIVLQSIIHSHFSWSQGIEEFFRLNNIAIATGGGLIDAMQENEIFIEAMKLGWEDFSNRGQKGAFPSGLFELQLV